MQRILLLAISTVAATLTITPASVLAEQPSLMQMIAQWQYPDSTMDGAEMADGATVDVNGKRTTQSIVCKTVMTTDATVEKVVDYYKAKLTPKSTDGDGIADAGGQSVVFSDDSDGRPFAMHTVTVNTADSSTTLIITRGNGESKTHIGWKHYRRINP